MTTIAVHSIKAGRVEVRDATPEEEAALAVPSPDDDNEAALVAAARNAVLDRLVAAELQNARSDLPAVEALREQRKG